MSGPREIPVFTNETLYKITFSTCQLIFYLSTDTVLPVSLLGINQLSVSIKYMDYMVIYKSGISAMVVQGDFPLCPIEAHRQMENDVLFTDI